MTVMCIYTNLFSELSPDGGVTGTPSIGDVVGSCPARGCFLLLKLPLVLDPMADNLFVRSRIGLCCVV